MEKYIVDFYSTKKGKQPAKDFLMTLDSKMLAKFLRITDLLENNGPQIGMPYSKSLEKGIFEIRVIQNSNIIRVLYFFTSNKKIILTNGFTKKSQKTPKAEIKKALLCKNDYERKNENE